MGPAVARRTAWRGAAGQRVGEGGKKRAVSARFGASSLQKRKERLEIQAAHAGARITLLRRAGWGYNVVGTEGSAQRPLFLCGQSRRSQRSSGIGSELCTYRTEPFCSHGGRRLPLKSPAVPCCMVYRIRTSNSGWSYYCIILPESAGVLELCA